MKKLILLIIISSLFACTPSEETILEGVWQSDLKITIFRSPEYDNLTPEKKDFLNSHQGDWHYSFRGNKTKVFFLDIPESEMESYYFQITSQTKDSITLKIYQQFIFVKHASQTVKLFFDNEEKNCFYILGYKYREYFCRQ